MYMFYLLFVATGRISLQCLIGVNVTRQINDFGMAVCCALKCLNISVGLHSAHLYRQ